MKEIFVSPSSNYPHVQYVNERWRIACWRWRLVYSACVGEFERHFYFRPRQLKYRRVIFLYIWYDTYNRLGDAAVQLLCSKGKLLHSSIYSCSSQRQIFHFVSDEQHNKSQFCSTSDVCKIEITSTCIEIQYRQAGSTDLRPAYLVSMSTILHLVLSVATSSCQTAVLQIFLSLPWTEHYRKLVFTHPTVRSVQSSSVLVYCIKYTPGDKHEYSKHLRREQESIHLFAYWRFSINRFIPCVSGSSNCDASFTITTKRIEGGNTPFYVPAPSETRAKFPSVASVRGLTSFYRCMWSGLSSGFTENFKDLATLPSTQICQYHAVWSPTTLLLVTSNHVVCTLYRRTVECLHVYPQLKTEYRYGYIGNCIFCVVDLAQFRSDVISYTRYIIWMVLYCMQMN